MSAHHILQHLHDRRMGLDRHAAADRPETTTFLCPDKPIGRMVGEAWVPPTETIASRRPPPKGRGSARGSLVCEKSNREVVFESMLEHSVAVILLARNDLEDLIDQPPAVTYTDATGRLRKHTFDYLAIMKDGTRIAIAVKAEARLESSGIGDTVAAIRKQVGAKFADRYVIRTERHVPRDRVHDAQLIRWARRGRNAGDIEAMGKIVGGLNGTVLIADLVRESGLRGRGFCALVNMIAEGVLVVQSHGPIDYPTRVARATVH